MIIVPGPASKDLGSKVADSLGVEAVPIEFKFFPDGESYIRYTGSLRGENVVVVQTTGPPQDINLVQLLLLIDAAKDLGARSVTAVVPYIAYARQDKMFRRGEVVSAKTVTRLLEATGVDRFITVNIHNPDALSEFRIPAVSLSAIPLLARFVKGRGLEGAFSLGPDEGAAQMVEEAAEILKGGYGFLKKQRDRVTGEIAFEKKVFDLKGKNAVVFDDIISTGGTTAAAVKTLRSQGAKKVFAACVHALLIADARDRILNSGAEEIIGTDSVPSSVSTVSIAPLIAEALKRGA